MVVVVITDGGLTASGGSASLPLSLVGNVLVADLIVSTGRTLYDKATYIIVSMRFLLVYGTNMLSVIISYGLARRRRKPLCIMK